MFNYKNFIKNENFFQDEDYPTFKIDVNLLNIRKDIIRFVENNSYLECDEGDYDIEKEYESDINDELMHVSFTTRRHGDVGSETPGQADIDEAIRVWKELQSSKFDVEIDIEEIDEWVNLDVKINYDVKVNENKDERPNRWFTVKKTQLDYWEQVITDKFARKVLGTVILKNGRISTRQYNLLKQAEQGNITPSLFNSKN